MQIASRRSAWHVAPPLDHVPPARLVPSPAAAAPPAAAQVLAQKQNLLNILSRTTGHSPEKLDKARGAALVLLCCAVLRCGLHCRAALRCALI